MTPYVTVLVCVLVLLIIGRLAPYIVFAIILGPIAVFAWLATLFEDNP